MTKNGSRQRIGLAVGGDLVFLHRLEQRALRLGRGAVHLVGQHQLREDGPRWKRNWPVSASNTETPMMSAGSRSLVNWMRW